MQDGPHTCKAILILGGMSIAVGFGMGFLSGLDGPSRRVEAQGQEVNRRDPSIPDTKVNREAPVAARRTEEAAALAAPSSKESATPKLYDPRLSIRGLEEPVKFQRPAPAKFPAALNSPDVAETSNYALASNGASA